MPHLTVAQNIFIGREPRRVGVSCSTKDDSTRRRASSSRRCTCRSTRAREVGELTVAQQQMVEIAKALSFNADVLIMDEPTAALTDDRDRRAVPDHPRPASPRRGRSSTSRTAWRSSSRSPTGSRSCATAATSTRVATDEATIERIISMMVGRTIFEAAPEVPEQRRRTRWCSRSAGSTAAGWSATSASSCAGRDPRLRRAGGRRPDRGRAADLRRRPARRAATILVDGKPVTIRDPADAVAHGLGYLSEDRKRYGLALGHGRRDEHRAGRAARAIVGPLGVVKTGETRATASEQVEHLAHQDALGRASRPATSPAATSRRSSSPSGSRATPTS